MLYTIHYAFLLRFDMRVAVSSEWLGAGPSASLRKYGATIIFAAAHARATSARVLHPAITHFPPANTNTLLFGFRSFNRSPAIILQHY